MSLNQNLGNLNRRNSIPVKVGNIIVGGDSPIIIQSMTNTDTADIDSTYKQILDLSNAGSEIVRVTVDREDSAKSLPYIKEKLLKVGCNVPIVGDFHYIGHALLKKFPESAKILDKYRINPGNVGFKEKKDIQFSSMIDVAIKNNKHVRIGVNWGSLDQDLLSKLMDENSKLKNSLDSESVTKKALVISCLDNAKKAEALGLTKDKIIISCKVSELNTLIDVYDDLAKSCDYALHLGLTEAGMGIKGIVSSTAVQGTVSGYNSCATGNCSQAFGYVSYASGVSSTSIGVNTLASASESTAVGFTSTASGVCSSAYGWKACSTGAYSSASGYCATATN